MRRSAVQRGDQRQPARERTRTRRVSAASRRRGEHGGLRAGGLETRVRSRGTTFVTASTSATAGCTAGRWRGLHGRRVGGETTWTVSAGEHAAAAGCGLAPLPVGAAAQARARGEQERARRAPMAPPVETTGFLPIPRLRFLPPPLGVPLDCQVIAMTAHKCFRGPKRCSGGVNVVLVV